VAVPAVWSTLLCSFKLTTASSWTTVYTVPAGKRLILREAGIQNLSGVSSAAGLSDNNQYSFWQQVAVAAGGVFTVPLWEVFNAGDIIQFIVTNQPWTVRLSGQLLDTP